MHGRNGIIYPTRRTKFVMKIRKRNKTPRTKQVERDKVDAI
jgi:hypothetical protein